MNDDLEEIAEADLYQEKDDADFKYNDDCPCGHICLRCLGISDRDFM